MDKYAFFIKGIALAQGRGFFTIVCVYGSDPNEAEQRAYEAIEKRAAERGLDVFMSTIEDMRKVSDGEIEPTMGFSLWTLTEDEKREIQETYKKSRSAPF